MAFDDAGNDCGTGGTSRRLANRPHATGEHFQSYAMRVRARQITRLSALLSKATRTGDLSTSHTEIETDRHFRTPAGDHPKSLRTTLREAVRPS